MGVGVAAFAGGGAVMVGVGTSPMLLDLSFLRTSGSASSGLTVTVLCLAGVMRRMGPSSCAWLDAAAEVRRRGVAGIVGVMPLMLAVRKCS